MCDHSVTADLTGWLGQFQRDCDAAIADLMQVCAAAADADRYRQATENVRFGIGRIILEHPEQLGEIAPERAARSCFLNVIGKYVTFLDRLIASQRVAQKGMVLDRNINSPEELQAFVNEVLEREFEGVARDRNLTNPRKVDCFAKASDYARETSKTYFQLRRALEHHGDTPEAEIVLPIKRVGLFIDGKEVTALPCDLKTGQVLSAGILDEGRTLPARKAIVLSPRNANDLVFTMRMVLAPEIFRSHIA
jgi:hypothetical protein